MEISEDFLQRIEEFDWDEDTKMEFIVEMLSLKPEERQEFLDEMIKKSFPNREEVLNYTKGEEC